MPLKRFMYYSTRVSMCLQRSNFYLIFIRCRLHNFPNSFATFAVPMRDILISTRRQWRQGAISWGPRQGGNCDNELPVIWPLNALWPLHSPRYFVSWIRFIGTDWDGNRKLSFCFLTLHFACVDASVYIRDHVCMCTLVYIVTIAINC